MEPSSELIARQKKHRRPAQKRPDGRHESNIRRPHHFARQHDAVRHHFQAEDFFRLKGVVADFKQSAVRRTGMLA